MSLKETTWEPEVVDQRTGMRNDLNSQNNNTFRPFMIQYDVQKGYNNDEFSTYLQYLEMRFSSYVRTYGAAMYMMQMILYTSVAVYAPALALSHGKR
jgi:hypothetical protein